MALSERARTLLLNALGAPDIVDEVLADVDESSAMIKRDGSQGPSANVSWENFKITNLAAPTSANDAARKVYVDDADAVVAAAALKRDGSNSPTANIPWGGFGITGISSLANGNTGQLTLNTDGSVTLGGTSSEQDYLVGRTSTQRLSIQGQTSGQTSAQYLFAKDGDGTDNVFLAISGNGTPTSTNNDHIFIGWHITEGQYEIRTGIAGSGTVRPLAFGTSSTHSQLVLNTDGTSTLSGQLKNADGTVGTPAISFSNDTDLGFYRIGANDFGVSVGNAKGAEFKQGPVANTGRFQVTGDGVAFGGAGVAQSLDIYARENLLNFAVTGGGAGFQSINYLPATTDGSLYWALNIVGAYDNDLVGNAEFLEFAWNGSDAFIIDTWKSGTGTARPLTINASGGGSNQVKLYTDGKVQIGADSGTSQHVINSALGTNGTDILTLTNGPAGTAGDPAGYLKWTINGTTRYIPFWE